jgi:peptidoglycan-associated lipoprotein
MPSLARTVSLSVSFLALAAVASGCRHEREMSPITPYSESTTDSQRGAVQQAATEADGGSLAFSDDVRRMCPGLDSPTFGYDSSLVQQQWTSTLRTLATCMKSGGLAKERLVLTGHADPRGDDDYNMMLGGRRAEAVRHAVVAFGVDVSKLDTTSRGKVDATGTDEAGYRHDRRVDVDLARSSRGATSSR